jgi:hypothetical protein
MRLFISYSTGDLEIVNQIADALRPHTEVFYWDKDKEPGTVAWQTIFGWIDTADMVLAVITDETVKRGISVGQEIGRAITKGKNIVPLVSGEVPSSELGCLHGVTYIPLRAGRLDEALQSIRKSILATKQRKEEQKRSLLWLGGIAAFLYLASSGGIGDDEDDFN